MTGKHRTKRKRDSPGKHRRAGKQSKQSDTFASEGINFVFAIMVAGLVMAVVVLLMAFLGQFG